MSHDLITTDRELEALCSEIAAAEVVGFDTEFVSEDSYRPELGLVQVAVGERLAAIDPQPIGDMRPFWAALAEGPEQVVAHAGRQELLFSLESVGKPPANLFDLQIAAGLVGYEYPAGYSALCFKLVGQRPPKGETRTDWRRRPLSDRQLDYAMNDVRYLLPMRDLLWQKLKSLDRLGWLDDEMAAWAQNVADSITRPRWRKVSGISGLSGTGLAIVREISEWRDQEAEKSNRPVRRVLRDDLIVELARLARADVKSIRSIRGMNHRGVERHLSALAECIGRALKSPEERRPRSIRRDTPSQLNMLGQFLSSALSSICRRADVAPSLVGTASDVRDLIAYRLGFYDSDDELPALAEGWRAEVVGHLLEDLLAGRRSIRIKNPNSDKPFVFEE